MDRFEPTSKVCSCCGHKEEKMPLKVREWVCPECGCVHDRDTNAARNILRAGASALVGAGVRQVACNPRRWQNLTALAVRVRQAKE